MKHFPLKIFSVLALPLFLLLSACSGGGNTNDKNSDTLGVNVAPVTTGSWYKPDRSVTWAWQLQGTLNTSYDVDIYDIDLFDTDPATIASLKADGRHIICYFSAGSYEDWRDDADKFPASALGSTLAGYADERWLDITSSEVFQIMLMRLDLAVDKGCDGVEPDNVTSFNESTGFDLTASDQLAFNRNLFNAAHKRGLAVALKNDLEQVDELVNYVDLMINEECHQYDECDQLQAFSDNNKPILNAEYLADYRTTPKPVCRDALKANMHTLILDSELDDSYRVSCDDDFPSLTRLADVKTYVTYYQQDAARIAEMSQLDLSIVQPVLSRDQVRSLQSHGKVVVYLSIGEIGLSNTYWYNGKRVLGQVIYDDHPDWFLAQNGPFDSYFADTRIADWQNFIVQQAGILLQQGYDGLFLDTVDTVDVYPDTIPGMVDLIHLLRTTYPDIALVQNRGMNVIPQTGADIDALMFEVFNTYYNYTDNDYRATDVNAPGYEGLVDKALDYRLDGGVVLSQDFALPEPAYQELICYARDRALQHLFIPSYADKFFQDGLFAWPDACPWPKQPGFGVSLNPAVLNVSIGRSRDFDINVSSYLGYDTPVSLSLGTAPANVTASLDDTLLSPTQSTTLTVDAGVGATAGTSSLELQASSDGQNPVYTPKLVVHDESIWVTNAGLSNVVAFDEPDTLSDATTIPDRKSGGVIAQPYAVAVDNDGKTWVVENVGDPGAVQPAGRVLRYSQFDLSTPEMVFDSGLSYPIGIAIDNTGTAWVANSNLDWTGTPVGAPDIVNIAPGASSVSSKFSFNLSYGYPKFMAFDASGNLWITTTYGLVVGYQNPGSLTGTPNPDMVIVAVGGDADFIDTINCLVFDASGNLWLSGTLSSSSASRIIKVTSGAWTTDGLTSTLNTADVPVVLENELFTPWGIAFDSGNNLWAVNSTDANDVSTSRGSLVRFNGTGLNSSSSPDKTIELDSRYTLGIAIGRP